MTNLAEIIGTLSGTLVLSAALPQIVRNILRPDDIVGQSMLRNLLITSGNGLWVVQGLMTANIPIVVTCALSALLNGVILSQVLCRRLNLPGLGVWRPRLPF